MLSRRKMLGASATMGAITAAAAAASVGKVAMAALPEPVIQTRPDTMPPLVPSTGRPPTTPSSRSTAGRCPGA